MMHTTSTLLAISTATLAADGWYDATVRGLARFATEALRDAAVEALAGMTTSERERFASSATSYEVTNSDRMRRERAIEILCSWAHVMRMRAFSERMERARVAARAEFPAAIEALGAAL